MQEQKQHKEKLFDGKNYFDCDEPNAVYDPACSQKCPNRSWRHGLGGNACVLNECPTSYPLRAEFGSCLDCNSTNIWIRQPNCSEVCPNRELSVSGMCVPKECPQDSPLRRDDGVCFSCDILDVTFPLENPEDCSKLCPNRMVWKSDSKYYNNNCVVKECPNGTIRGTDGRCLPCESYMDSGDMHYEGQYMEAQFIQKKAKIKK